MATQVIEPRLADLVAQLENTADLNQGLQRLLQREIRRRLNRYELTDRRFKEKYGMTFDDFQQQEMVKEKGYSFEVETDFCDWEMARSGIRALEDYLAEVKDDA
jgi:hypothetical protein